MSRKSVLAQWKRKRSLAVWKNVEISKRYFCRTCFLCCTCIYCLFLSVFLIFSSHFSNLFGSICCKNRSVLEDFHISIHERGLSFPFESDWAIFSRLFSIETRPALRQMCAHWHAFDSRTVAFLFDILCILLFSCICRWMARPIWFHAYITQMFKHISLCAVIVWCLQFI